MSTYIKGIGISLPEKIVTNADLASFGEIDDEWIISRTGIHQRHIAGSHETTLSLAVIAANSAILNAGIGANEIDLVIISTITPEHPLPSTAAQLQHRINAINAAAFDIRAACTGFIYGLHIARAFIESSMARNVLLVCSETLSRVTNWQDTQTFPLFGDGAGAMVISAQNGFAEVIDTTIHCDGQHDKLLFIPAGGSALPMSTLALDSQGHTIHMNGKEVFRHAVSRMVESCQYLLSKQQLTIDDIDIFIPHQANKRIIDRIATNLHFPSEKVFSNICKIGNTSAASIPLALCEAMKEGKLPHRGKILTTAFGAGFTWGASLITFN